MALLRLEDFDPNYREIFGNNDIKGYTTYVEGTEEKVGSVSDILVNESGYFRCLVIDFGLWIFNKKVLLPVGCCRIDHTDQRVYVLGLNRKQAENLPEYSDSLLVEYDYGDAKNYQQESVLYNLGDENHPLLKQLQDQLIAKQDHNNTDETGLVQEVESEANQIETLVEKEQADVMQPQLVSNTPESNSEKAARSACLIFNPVAGQSDPEQDLETIQSLLQPEINLDIRTTTPEIDADQLAHEAVERGAEIIIASGGDGTLSATAQAVVGTGIPLGIISRGTANAFATALGIPTGIEAACQIILDGTTRVVDAASCNGRPMILLAGIGFEAKTVERADRGAKDRFGLLAYVLAGFQELSENLQHFKTEIETEDKLITLNALAITIANAAPTTSVLAQGPGELVIDDGLLDVTLVAPASTMDAMTAAYDLLQSAFRGAMSQRPDTGYFQTRKLKVTTDPPQQVVLDGELIGTTPIEVESIPDGLTVFVPTATDSAQDPTENLEGLPDLNIELKEPKDS